MSIIKLTGLIPIVCFLGACFGGGSHSDLRAYVEEVKARPAGSIEELPSFRPFEAFVYASVSLRSPFDLPVDVKQRRYVSTNKNVKPDFAREREYLETFDLGALSMVGTLEQRNTLWALIEDGSGGIHRVRTGNFAGKNHGRIVSTSETKVELLEIVSDGLNGWVERPRILALSEKEK